MKLRKPMEYCRFEYYILSMRIQRSTARSENDVQNSA